MRSLVFFVMLCGCTGTVVLPEGRDPIATGRCRPGIPETTRIPRLTHAQYENTVQDLLALPDARPSTMLPPESTGEMDTRSWEGYQRSAEALAAEAVSTPSAWDHIVPCTPSDDGAACASETIAAFGRRAFRRRLREDERGRFEALYANRAAMTEGGTFEEGIELIVEAFLQSPSFLLRAELSTETRDGRIPLGDDDVASRLSYLIWNTMPDDALLDAAEAGELSSAEQVRAQAERMVRAPRARGMVEAFHRRWLGMDGGAAARWQDIVRDPERYPDFSPDLIPLLTDETLAFVDSVVFEDERGFQALLTSTHGFVNATLAPAYGLDPAAFGETLERTDLGARRGGVFTRAGFLASHAMFDRTSPILRGAFLQDHVLCRSLGTPPPGAEMTPLPELTPDIVTTRDRVSVQTSPRECSSCHAIINPTGFAFEHFDALGAWRDLDNGASVDATGIAPLGDADVPYDGASDLSASMAESPEAHGCYAVQWVEFAYRRPPTDEDLCVVEALSERLSDDGYTILDLVVDLTQTEIFMNRSAEVSP